MTAASATPFISPVKKDVTRVRRVVGVPCELKPDKVGVGFVSLPEAQALSRRAEGGGPSVGGVGGQQASLERLLLSDTDLDFQTGITNIISSEPTGIRRRQPRPPPSPVPSLL